MKIMYLPEYQPQRYTNEQGFTVAETPQPDDLSRVGIPTPAADPPVQTFGDVGQGYRGTPEVPFDPARLGDHEYYLAHKAEIPAFLADL